ncbi:MAG: DUF2029 domain-containing protein [Deltaproteobacteria bacterium]|nr:DUF2029 domain-containing protein [Deltaproteobacteria bacterium]MBW1921993.1 DUF2029 domain-containing protein [Deltaproteobacteria bacterium]MBW1950161.1 DUF2029 domain-containing protein [Deltaproteobacteria bacterium]MBW2008123.1 DUF2029 domain-containing protein [Deltaproteobacteria bacterium]MBW2348611.1 DUF2029 domain-containing protein [Deltaproteobacteria bacterium]
MHGNRTRPTLSPRTDRVQTPVPPGAATLFVVVVAALCAVYAWNYGRARPGTDFYQAWAVGRYLLHEGGGNVYSDEGRLRLGRFMAEEARKTPAHSRHRFLVAMPSRKIPETYSTPFLYAALVPFNTSRYETAYQAYLLFIALCGPGSILLLVRTYGLNPWLGAALLLYFAFGFEPALSDLRVANVNQFQLLQAAVLFLVLRRRGGLRHLWGGILLGLMVLFKPNTAFCVPLLGIWLAAGRRWSALKKTGAGLFGGAGLAVLCSTLSFGTPRAWAWWWDALGRMPDRIITVSQGNFSAVVLLKKSLGAGVAWSFALALGAVTAAVLWRWGREAAGKAISGTGAGDEGGTHAVAAGLVLYLLTAPLAWVHYYVLALPMITGLLQRVSGGVSRREGSWFRAAALCLGAGAMLALYPLRLQWGGAQATTAAFLACGGALVLYLEFVAWAWGRGDPGSPSGLRSWTKRTRARGF